MSPETISKTPGKIPLLQQPLSKHLYKTAVSKFRKLGIETVGELLFHFPFRYIRWGQKSAIAALKIGENATVSAQVKNATWRSIRRGGYLFEATITDGTDILSLVFFPRRQHTLDYYRRLMKPGQWGFFEGKVEAPRKFGDPLQLKHPSLVMIDPEDPASVAEGKALSTQPQPVYHTTDGLSNAVITKSIRMLLGLIGPKDIQEFLPENIRNEENLIGIEKALRLIHEPVTEDDIEAARKRFKFDEAFILQTALAMSRTRATSRPAPACPKQQGGLAERFDQGLPFPLTPGQIEAGENLSTALGKETAAQILLQGDVGAGKTLVATRAMVQVVESGKQAVLLAPTEVLANQHYLTLASLLKWDRPGDPTLELLTGSAKATQRRQVLARAASGEPGIYVGTHALLSEQVQLPELGLVVVDEQHRFGVAQREKLRQDPRFNPHLLVMTATPIPRTVAMTMFSDLEVLRLAGRPHEGGNIETFVVYAGSVRGVERTWERAAEEIQAGRRVFVVCPRIENTDPEPEPLDDDLVGTERKPTAAVLELAEQLRSLPVLKSADIGIMHSRLDPQVKTQTMEELRSGKIQLLVSTTVIEVGVDIPAASMMVIMDADRFGLSQLHQLRGRIGRDGSNSLCLALTWFGPDSTAGQRLDAFRSSDDGFVLAEADFRLRREGDILGSAQSGRSRLKMLDLQADADLIERARDQANCLVESDPDLNNHVPLAVEMVKRLDEESQEYLQKS